MTQDEFATRFHLPLGTVRDWEQGAHRSIRPRKSSWQSSREMPDAVVRAIEG